MADSPKDVEAVEARIALISGEVTMAEMVEARGIDFVLWALGMEMTDAQ